MGDKRFHRRAGRRQGAVGEAVQVAEPRPRRPRRDPDAVALRETRYVGLVDRDRRHPEVACGSYAAVAQQRRRSQMHYVGLESAQRTRAFAGTGHTQRQRGHLREHPRRHPMHPDAVVDSLGRGFTGRGVGSDDQRFVAGSAQMLEYSKY